jgi:hypothetical protein
MLSSQVQLLTQSFMGLIQRLEAHFVASHEMQNAIDENQRILVSALCDAHLPAVHNQGSHQQEFGLIGDIKKDKVGNSLNKESSPESMERGRL